MANETPTFDLGDTAPAQPPPILELNIPNAVTPCEIDWAAAAMDSPEEQAVLLEMSLLYRIAKYAREDRAITPGCTRLARALDQLEKHRAASAPPIVPPPDVFDDFASTLAGALRSRFRGRENAIDFARNCASVFHDLVIGEVLVKNDFSVGGSETSKPIAGVSIMIRGIVEVAT